MDKDLSKLANLRNFTRSCYNCAFYREHQTIATTGECLLLGRTLSAASPANRFSFLTTIAMNRVCDGWKKYDSKQQIYCKGRENNPHFRDKIFSREQLQELRAVFIKKQLNK